jgi:uncharacterized protein YfiM (DUF2279 family)
VGFVHLYSTLPASVIGLFPLDRTLLFLSGLLLIGALPNMGLARPPGAPAADSLSAAAVSFQLRYGTVPSLAESQSRDRWIARDKAKHVAFSALWTLSTQYVLVVKADWRTPDALPASIASGAAVGLAKELYDASRPNGSASGKDLVADAVGIGLAVGVIVL